LSHDPLDFSEDYEPPPETPWKYRRPPAPPPRSALEVLRDWFVVLVLGFVLLCVGIWFSTDLLRFATSVINEQKAREHRDDSPDQDLRDGPDLTPGRETPSARPFGTNSKPTTKRMP
jgi:hypothetical protein